VFTDFPLASSVVTGLFMDVTLSGPQGPAQTYDKTLYDAIGYVARQGDAAVTVTANATSTPSISPFQVWSVSVLAGVQDRAAAVSVENHLQNNYAILESQATDSPLLTAMVIEVLAGQSRSYLLSLLSTSDEFTGGLAENALVEAYFDRPRITVVSALL